MRRGLFIAGGLALAMAVANGLARFAYALVLPAMKADLGWTYMQAGSLNTINAVGYLLGSYIAFRTVRRWGPKRPFIAGLWLTTACVIVTGATRDFYMLSTLRFLAGIAGAYVFIAGSVLAASIFPEDARRSATAIAIYFGGGGAGLLASGVALPWLFARGGDAVWPEAWVLLGVMCFVGSALASLAAWPTSPPPAQSTAQAWRKLPFLATFFAYGCFALGYFAYMTFIVAWMSEHGLSALEVAVVWSVLGISTMVAPRVWGRPIATWTGGKAVSAVLAAIGIGAALPIASASFLAMLVSATLFGVFFMAPAAVTAIIKRALAPALWGEAVAAFTVLFSVLQCLGPVLTGGIADLTGSLAVGLGASVAVLLLGSAVALLQREHSG